MLARPSDQTLAQGRITRGDFRPHPLLRNPHLQTLAPALLRPIPRVPLRFERWERPDGDFIDLGWCGPEDLPPQAALPSLSRTAGEGRAKGGAVGGVRAAKPGKGPLVILLHGMTGGFDSKYALGLGRELIKIGWRAVIMQFRGAGPEPNRLPRCYHHGDTGDLRDLVLQLHEREPQTPLFAMGWSLGANVLLKYLGESGGTTPLSGAAAACAPFQLEPCAEKLRTGFARVYQNKLLRELKANLRRKFATMPSPINLDRALRARDFFELDNTATAPLNGFSSAQDYYARCSSGQFLRNIQRSTLIVNAVDDPFMTPAIIPSAAQLSPHVTLELCEFGGHVGFISADRQGRLHWWLEQRIAEFLQSLTAHK